MRKSHAITPIAREGVRQLSIVAAGQQACTPNIHYFLKLFSATCAPGESFTPEKQQLIAISCVRSKLVPTELRATGGKRPVNGAAETRQPR
jgi:hypothetical protein